MAEQACDELEKEGISVELIDPRVLIPLDTEKIFESVKKPGVLPLFMRHQLEVDMVAK